MSDPRGDDHNRWRELHELLGLPPDEPATRFDTTAPPVQPSPVSRSAPPEKEEPLGYEPLDENGLESGTPDSEGGVELEPNDLAAGAEEEDDVPIGEAPAEMPDEDMEEESASDEELAAERAELEGDVKAPDEEEDRARGRRRGRRGRRGRGRREQGADEPGATGADSAESAADDDDEREPEAEQEEPRGRGRGGRRGRRDVAAQQEPSAPAEAEDDEPVEALTDWNVPSWNEIVASLYRPER